MPVSTLHSWRAQPEFARLRTEKREDVAADMWAAFQKGVRRMSELMDTAEDLTKVAIASGVIYDKLALMSGAATSRTETRSLADDYSDQEKEKLRNWIDSLPAADLVPASDPV